MSRVSGARARVCVCVCQAATLGAVHGREASRSALPLPVQRAETGDSTPADADDDAGRRRLNARENARQ